ncbi:hypothetical protein FIBSPDRAFT_963061 [Athelia psychrophila]|uniref:DUF6533 domain-containing protein n=1 Tax=Athelia psychrophila TaxID=1759441 RepID=A0A165ZCU3_9AGAM|nr:hypothetical protein FIBSPDRAFT_963061 [Fibularhizoctonia sp. CBS 109695]
MVSPPTPDPITLLKDSIPLEYFNAAIFTVLAWDILICFTEELGVAATCGFSVSSVAYFASRIGVMLWSMLILVMQVAPVAHCEVLWCILMTVAIIAGSASSLLFVIRVCAVYEKSKPVTLFFGIFWLAVPAVSSLVAISAHVSHTFPGSEKCNITGTSSYTSICQWVKAAFDTSVFIAITMRIISYSKADRASKPSSWHSLRGAGLPRIYRDLLHGGLLFYFVTIGVTLMGALAMLFSINMIDRLGLTQPQLAVESVVACRVFRRMVLDSRKPDRGLRQVSENISLTAVSAGSTDIGLSQNTDFDK